MIIAVFKFSGIFEKLTILIVNNVFNLEKHCKLFRI